MPLTDRLARVALLAGLATAAPLAIACGYCVEDRVAAVYDHQAVRAALGKHRHVAFFVVEGALERNDGVRSALVAAIEKGGGVRGTARVALDSAALSVAYDPARATPASLAAAANEPLAARGLALSPLRLIDASGEMRAP